MKLFDFRSYIGLPSKDPQPAPEPEKHQGPKEIHFSWQTTVKRDTATSTSPKITRTFIVIGIAVALLLAIMQEIWLIILIASLVFFKYAMSNLPTETITHELSNHGVAFAGKLYMWTQLKDFFFSSTSGEEVLVINTKDVLPGRLFLTFAPQDKQTIKETLDKYLTYIEQEPLSAMDKLYLSIKDKLNFETK